MYQISEAKTANQDARLQRLHDRLVDEVDKLVTGDDWIRALQVAARFRAYSPLNAILIWTQFADAYAKGAVPEPEPSMVAGIYQWNALGRTVIRGQHGFAIRLPVLGRYAAESPSAPEGTWRKLAPREDVQPGEVLRRKFVTTKIGHVFDYCQTQGEPIEMLPAPALLTGEAPTGLWDGVATQVAEQGFDLRLVDSAAEIGGANGLTNYATKTVSIRTDVAPLSMSRTGVHELAHVVAHGPSSEDVAMHRGVVEVEAESTAALVLGAHGVDTSQYTVPYVATWAGRVSGKSQTEVVMDTFHRVGRIATGILDKLETAQIPNGLPTGLDREAAARERDAAVGARRGGPTAASTPEPKAEVSL